MSSVAIYGDSFGQYYENAWPQYLQSILKSTNLRTFAFSGSSLEYSYAKFLETHEDYDIIIFLLTTEQRTSLIIKDEDRYNILAGVIPGQKLKYCFDYVKNNKNIFSFWDKNIENWIKFEWHFSRIYPFKNSLVYNSMKDSIKLRRPDTFFIECFSSKNNPGIHNITKEDMSQYSKVNIMEDISIRKNHMTNQQNIEFAKYMYLHLTNSEFDIHDTFFDVRKYYTMSNSFEESGFIFQSYE